MLRRSSSDCCSVPLLKIYTRLRRQVCPRTGSVLQSSETACHVPKLPWFAGHGSDDKWPAPENRASAPLPDCRTAQAPVDLHPCEHAVQATNCVEVPSLLEVRNLLLC